MIGFIIWLIIIIVIIRNIKSNQERQKKLQEEYSKKFASSYTKKSSSNSYYTENKMKQYERMNQEHDSHSTMMDKERDDIGYKRCPKCDTAVNKKADVCFMCDYTFDNKK